MELQRREARKKFYRERLKMKIPYLNLGCIHEPIQKELGQVYQNVINSQWFIHGKYCQEFEKDYADYCGAKYCIGVGNGLDAIRIILQAMGIGAGDEVIVPANTFIATVLAITYVGATPVLVDADPETYNIDPDKVEEKITYKTKAIIAVHLYGRIADVGKLRELKEKYCLKIIEDAAQAHGGELGNKKAGTLGDAAAFSFYPGKNLGALGDGGAVVTNDEKLADMVRAIANYGSKEKYVHLYKGCNSRLDELQAGFLKVKLPYLDGWNEERRAIAHKYNSEIRNKEFQLPKWEGGRNHVFHIYPLLCSKREKLARYLKEKGIDSNVHYPTPIYRQNAYREYLKDADSYPVTNKICCQEISIPLYPGLSEEEQDYIIDCLNTYQG